PVQAAQRGSSGEGAGSRYPAKAQYPRRVARPSEFAHSSSSSGGAPGPSAPSTTQSKASTKAPSKRAAKKPKPGLHGDPARALVAYQAMQQNFYIPGSGLYEGEPYSYLWPFLQAFGATISVASISGQAA